MSPFGKALKRELGKNTGKLISNKLFGDGHSTPYRLKIQRERQLQQEQKEALKNERRIQREEAREYKLRQKEEERERREREKELAKLEKEELIEANEKEVEDHQNYIEFIQSIHKDWSEAVNWNDIANTPPPEEIIHPSKKAEYYRRFTDEQIDQRIKDLKSKYEESTGKKIFDKVFNQTENFFTKKLFKDDYEKLDELNREIADYELKRSIWFEEYMQEHQEEYDNYLSELEDHKLLLEIADGVKKGEKESFIYALNFFNPFADLSDFGIHIDFKAHNEGLEVDFFPYGQEIVPNTIKSTIKKGLEISEKPMNQNIVNEIYQDYVCSSVLRIAKETFQLLPIDKILINVHAELLNSKTGNMDDSIIISCVINRKDLERLNFNLLDPSDSMNNFKHNMKFSKSKGFEGVDKLTSSSVFTTRKIKPTQELKESPKKERASEPKKNSEPKKEKKSNTTDFLIFQSNMTVQDVKDQFLKIYKKEVEVMTEKGNPAGENRKLRALSPNDLGHAVKVEAIPFNNKLMNEIKKATKLVIKQK
jgi:hypothetical protein